MRRFLKVHADGEWADAGEVAASIDRKPLPLDARLESTVDGLQKIVAMRLNVEPDQVRAQQPLQ